MNHPYILVIMLIGVIAVFVRLIISPKRPLGKIALIVAAVAALISLGWIMNEGRKLENRGRSHQVP